MSADNQTKLDEALDRIETLFEQGETAAACNLIQNLLAQAEARGREHGEKIWRREHDHWKRTAEQFLKREQLKTEPPVIVVDLASLKERRNG